MSAQAKTKTKTKSKSTKSTKPTKPCACPSTGIPPMGAFCIGIVGAMLGACAVGALTIVNLNKSNSAPIPTVAKARTVCEQYNGKEVMQSGEILQSSELGYAPLLIYACEYNGNPHTTGIEFAEVYADDGAAALAQAKSNYEKNLANLAEGDTVPTTLENSDTFLKYYMAFPEEENVYYVAVYGNTSLSMFAPSVTAAEQILVDLGFPARSQATE
ncbi:hypothetical protein IKE79_00365 [Candidatus Saccharibacteria bacterium]|nr:hypothetical protein [Candidatus Saccharibacteria bacterium]